MDVNFYCLTNSHVVLRILLLSFYCTFDLSYAQKSAFFIFYIIYTMPRNVQEEKVSIFTFMCLGTNFGAEIKKKHHKVSTIF